MIFICIRIYYGRNEISLEFFEATRMNFFRQSEKIFFVHDRRRILEPVETRPRFITFIRAIDRYGDGKKESGERVATLFTEIGGHRFRIHSPTLPITFRR